MTTRTLVFAIAEYYGISVVEAAVRLAERTKDDEFGQVEEWYFSNQEE